MGSAYKCAASMHPQFLSLSLLKYHECFESRYNVFWKKAAVFFKLMHNVAIILKKLHEHSDVFHDNIRGLLHFC